MTSELGTDGSLASVTKVSDEVLARAKRMA